MGCVNYLWHLFLLRLKIDLPSWIESIFSKDTQRYFTCDKLLRLRWSWDTWCKESITSFYEVEVCRLLNGRLFLAKDLLPDDDSEQRIASRLELSTASVSMKNENKDLILSTRLTLKAHFTTFNILNIYAKKSTCLWVVFKNTNTKYYLRTAEKQFRETLLSVTNFFFDIKFPNEVFKLL